MLQSLSVNNHLLQRKIVIVKQKKHGLPPQDAKTIPFQTVNSWLINAQKLLATYAEEYQIIYVFITNKNVTHIVAPTTLWWPENLIVVHRPNLLDYYGPSVFQIASLSDEELNL
jgi:hypothetical protein